MPTTAPVFETFLEGIKLHGRGKVRDIYEVEDSLLIVATDRISAYDFVLASPIPDKGKVLTHLSAFWFDRTQDIVANHMLSVDSETYPESLRPYAELLSGRSMLVRRARPVLIECVARGYLSGSGWREYKETGHVCGIQLPAGLKESDRLPEPIFTPATKATDGHDLNISQAEAAKLVGEDLVERLRELTLALYGHGSGHAESCGIIVADTKFEFGLVGGDGDELGGSEEILLIDEVLTPDSSRFWPKETYVPGRGQTSFDKQFVRDYLDEIKWNHQPPVPELPASVIDRTRQKYIEAFQVLSGRELV